MSKLSICHASLLESYLSVKLAICQSYLFVMLATCHSYMSKQLAHLVPVLRKFLVKLPLTTCKFRVGGLSSTTEGGMAIMQAMRQLKPM